MSPLLERISAFTVLRLAIVFMSVGLVAAACGSDEAADTSGIASLTDGEDDDSAADGSTLIDDAAEAPENAEDAFALFDECMTDRGFEFASTASSSGAVGSLSIEGGSAVTEVDPQSGGIEDFDLDEFEAANDECRVHLANIDGGFDLTPEQEAAFEDAQLEFQSCMSDAGIEMPDIIGGGSGGLSLQVEEVDGDLDPQAGAGFTGSDFDFEAFQEAAETCNHVFDDIGGLALGSDQ